MGTGQVVREAGQAIYIFGAQTRASQKPRRQRPVWNCQSTYATQVASGLLSSQAKASLKTAWIFCLNLNLTGLGEMEAAFLGSPRWDT